MSEAMLGLTSFDIEVLCWRDVRGSGELPNLTVHLMAGHLPLRWGETGFQKWAGRFVRAPHRNFLAATREEADQVTDGETDFVCP